MESGSDAIRTAATDIAAGIKAGGVFELFLAISPKGVKKLKAPGMKNRRASEKNGIRTLLFACLFFWLSISESAALAGDEFSGLEDDRAAGWDMKFGISDIDELMGLRSIAEDELSEIRGGESAAISLQNLDSTVEGNSISGTVTTGSVSIAGNAFSHLDGVSSVVVNSGNNVSIQSSTVINVVIGE